MKFIRIIVFVFTVLVLSLPLHSLAAEEVNVDTIKEKYWAKGEQAEMGVVQNRLYSKARKFEVGFYGGIISSDPFLTVKNAGASVGFHFSEYLGLNFIAWKSYSSPSTALQTFEETIGATTNNNKPQGFYGAEGAASILYGKLSLVGRKIIYYDFHLLGGVGQTQTESGNYITPFAGLGQQTYLSSFFSLRIDYRLMRYEETIIEKVITPKLGKPVGNRINWSNSITVGITLLWGPGK